MNLKDIDTKYEIFGVISLDNFELGQILTFVKKRLKSIKKYQWFKFSDGEYHEIDQNEVLNNYFPLLVFYRQIN